MYIGTFIKKIIPQLIVISPKACVLFACISELKFIHSLTKVSKLWKIVCDNQGKSWKIICHNHGKSWI